MCYLSHNLKLFTKDFFTLTFIQSDSIYYEWNQVGILHNTNIKLLNIIQNFPLTCSGYKKYGSGKDSMPYFQGVMTVHLATHWLENGTLGSLIYY